MHGNDHQVGAEKLFVLGNKAIEMLAPDLFLPFDQELHIQRERSAVRQIGLDALQMNEDLPFIVL